MVEESGQQSRSKRRIAMMVAIVLALTAAMGAGLWVGSGGLFPQKTPETIYVTPQRTSTLIVYVTPAPSPTSDCGQWHRITASIDAGHVLTETTRLDNVFMVPYVLQAH